MNTAHRENAIFSLGQLQQQYYDLNEIRKAYLNRTGKQDATAIRTIIDVLKMMIEYSEEINWFMLHDYKSDLKQYEEIFDKIEDNPYKPCDYTDLIIGDLTCNICGKDHDGDCKEV